MTADTEYDVCVIGGGFAGLSAAMWLARYKRKTLVISSGPPRNHTSHAIHGYPGLDGADPVDVLTKMRQEATAYGATIEEDWIRQAGGTLDDFKIVGSTVTCQAKRIILATGTVDQKPDIPGFAQYEEASIWQCPACDGLEYEGKSLAIVGWGPHIADFANNFKPYASRYAIFTHGHEPPAQVVRACRQAGIEVHTSPVRRLGGKDNRLHALELADGYRYECAGLFYSIRHTPRLELAKQLGCKLTEDFLYVDRQQQTSVPGVYAAGDVSPHEELVVVACATGTIAASNLHKSL